MIALTFYTEHLNFLHIIITRPLLTLDLSSSDTMMKHGSTLLLNFVTGKLETAMGKAMP